MINNIPLKNDLSFDMIEGASVRRQIFENHNQFINFPQINKDDESEIQDPDFVQEKISQIDSRIFQFDKSQNKFDFSKVNREIWIKRFFLMIFFINRFIYRIKKPLSFHRPYLLKQTQLRVIRDKGANDQFEYNKGLKSSSEQLKSKYQSKPLSKKIRLILLKLKKQSKLICYPIQRNYEQFELFMYRMLKPLPIFDPFQYSMLYWDFIYLAFLVTNIVNIPFCLSFQQQQNQIFQRVSLSIILINLIKCLNTSYYSKGTLKFNRKKILKHTVIKVFPLELVYIISVMDNPFGEQIVKLLIIFKISDLQYLFNKFRENFQLDDNHSAKINIITLIIKALLFCHLACCIWHYIGYQQQINSIPDNWLNFYNLTYSSTYTKYIKSLYFCVITMCTIGFGDIVPQTEIEMIFIIILALSASGGFGYVINQVGTIISEHSKSEEQFKIKRAELNQYFHQRNVNPDLQTKARKYLQYIYEEGLQNKTTPEENLSCLSRFLREEIKKQIYLKSLENIPIIKNNFSKACLEKLSLKMTETCYGPEEIILKNKHFEEPRLYIISQGKIELFIDLENQYGDDKYRPLQTLGKGQIFGIEQFFSNNLFSQYSARSLTVSYLQHIQLKDFLDIIQEYPDDKQAYMQMKDKLILYKDYFVINAECISCKSGLHQLQNCPFLFYKPNERRVIKIYIQNFQEYMHKFKRNKKRKKFATLKNRFKQEEKIFAAWENDELDLFQFDQVDENQLFQKDSDDDNDEESENEDHYDQNQFLQQQSQDKLIEYKRRISEIKFRRKSIQQQEEEVLEPIKTKTLEKMDTSHSKITTSQQQKSSIEESQINKQVTLLQQQFQNEQFNKLNTEISGIKQLINELKMIRIQNNFSDQYTQAKTIETQNTSHKRVKTSNRLLVNGDKFESICQYSNYFLNNNYDQVLERYYQFQEHLKQMREQEEDENESYKQELTIRKKMQRSLTIQQIKRKASQQKTNLNFNSILIEKIQNENQ